MKDQDLEPLRADKDKYKQKHDAATSKYFARPVLKISLWRVTDQKINPPGRQGFVKYFFRIIY